MTTSNLTIQQRGNYTPATGVWSDAVFSIVALSPGVEAWLLVNKTPLLTAFPTALTLNITTDFAETATLGLLAFTAPVTVNFSTGGLVPDATRVAVVQSTSVALALGANAITLPLTDSHGKATPLHGAARSRLRAHTNGTHYFAVGLRWSGTGGTLLTPSLSATYSDEFTGWGGERGTAGVDRAVRCPRCGNVAKEADLVADGYTRTPVCARCYDPPPEPSSFQWPFR